MIRRSSAKSEMQQEFSHKKQQKQLLQLKLKNRSSSKQSPKLSKRQSLRIKKEQKQGQMNRKTGQKQEQQVRKEPDKKQLQNKPNNKQKKMQQNQLPNKNQKGLNKQQKKGESKKNEQQANKYPTEKFQLYIKTKFPYQFSRTYTFPTRSEKEYKDDAVIHYVDSIQSFFAYGQVEPFFYAKEKKQAGQKQVEEKNKRWKKMNQQQKQQQLKKKLINIQSVFMTSKNVHFSQARNKDMPLKLVKNIRQHNRDAKICVEVDKFYTEYPKIRNDIEQDFKKQGCKAMKTNFTSDNKYKIQIKQGDQKYTTFKRELKQNLQKIKDTPLFFQRPKTVFQQSCFHTKIWLIKFNNKKENKKTLRIIISTANIDDFWEESANMFWVKQFDVEDEDKDEPLHLDPNPKYLDSFDVNTNQDFINTLQNVVFKKQRQWGILQSLSIKLHRLKVQGINFFLIPSIPCQKFMPNQKDSGFSDNIGLKKISKYTKIYYQKNTQLLEKYLGRLFVLTPNYLKCNRKFISKIQQTFFDERLKNGLLTNQVLLMYPSNKFIYKRIYKDCALGNKQDRIIKGYFAFKQNQRLPFPPQEHVQNQSIRQTEIQEVSQNQSNRVLFSDYSCQTNRNHRIKAYKCRRTWDFSFPHLKACFVTFRSQKKNIGNKTIFYFGSHNFTPAAWQNCEQNANDNKKRKWQFDKKGNKYQYTISNNQLGLLFFDFPGLLEHVLPLRISLDKKNSRVYDQYQRTEQDQGEIELKQKQGRFTLYKKGYQIWKQKYVEPQQKNIQIFREMFKKYLKDFYEEQCAFDYPIVQGQSKFCQYNPNISLQSCFENNEQLFMSADVAVWKQVGSKKYIKKIYLVKTQFHKTKSKELCEMTRNHFSQPNRGYLQFYHFTKPKEFIKILQIQNDNQVIKQKVNKCIVKII